MAAGFVYRNTLLYEAVMLLLYGRHYPARYRAIADLIPAGASVVDLCCGPAHLYQRHLKRQGVRYTGLDLNPRFVERVNRLGGVGEVWDLLSNEPLPEADYHVMQASLYHFLPDPTPIVDRMLRAARRQVIIAEPVRNLSDANVPVLSRMARKHTNPGAGSVASRFTEQALDQFFGRYSDRVLRSFLIPGGREKIYVLHVGR